MYGFIRYFISLGILFLSILSLFSKDYSLEELVNATNEVNSAQEYFSIYLDFYKNSTDKVILKKVTSAMAKIDYDSTFTILKEKYNKSQGNDVVAYLYGSILKDPVKSIEIGRKVIALNKELECGYRLITETYAKKYFFHDDENTDKLKELFPEDEALFEYYYSNYNSNDGSSRYTYCKYLIFKERLNEAENLLDKAEENEEVWTDAELFSDFYTIKGDYENAVIFFIKEAIGIYSNLQEGDHLTKWAEINLFFKLVNSRKYKEAHNFIHTAEYIPEKERYFWESLSYCIEKEKEKAIAAIRRSVELGWDNVLSVQYYKELEYISVEPEWSDIQNMIEANRDTNENKRKKVITDMKFLREIPDVTFQDSNGKEFTIESIKGSIIILDFWATWCKECLTVMPSLSKYALETPEDVRILAVNIWEENDEKAIQMFKEKEYNIELVFGMEGLKKIFGFDGIPHMCAIDRNGNLRYEKSGSSSNIADYLKWWIEDLKAEE
ncbi:MAG: redoxin domain-containing protein [Candidatus Delongbacteria bacterium]|nr:redoxin domain-containing protein [Candidatus Delongbacteria bacterium]